MLSCAQLQPTFYTVRRKRKKKFTIFGDIAHDTNDDVLPVFAAPRDFGAKVKGELNEGDTIVVWAEEVAGFDRGRPTVWYRINQRGDRWIKRDSRTHYLAYKMVSVFGSGGLS